VDLPNATERAEVLRAAILAHKRNPDNFDFPAIAAKTQDFTGSEIAALVPEAMYAAFSEDREFITPDLLIAAANTVPLSKTAQKSVDDLRKWAQGRAKNASITTSNTSKQNRALAN
jgi:ATP-dependent 26S proteasome regulatory subunit